MTGNMARMISDDEAAREILQVFIRYQIRAGGTLRRNYFIQVRDAIFQRGLNRAIEKNWVKIKTRDRYTYELTEDGLAAG